MADPTTGAGEIVKEYVRQYQTWSSTAIAKLIVQEAPLLYNDVESARNSVRYYRGSHGNGSRSRIAVDSLIPKIEIPEPEETVDFRPYIIDAFPIIIASDVHIPYHDRDALEMVIDRAIDIGAKTLVMNGDWIDMYQASRFMKDPRMVDLNGELDMFRSIVGVIRSALPDCRIVFKLGNHEERWDHLLMTKAPEVFGVEATHLKNVLDVGRYGVEIVDHKRIVKAGHLFMIHGHEYIFNISNPVVPARGVYLRTKKSTLCGHFHQTSEYSEPNIADKVTTCWTIGGLCGLHPQYMPLNKWNLGFAEAYQDDEDSFSVRNRKIINYKLV